MEHFHATQRISPEHFEDLVEEAIESIPDALWERIDNLAVVVEAWPSAAQRASVGLERHGLLLGLYECVPLTARTHSYGMTPPDKITIFRGPILQICPPTDEAIRQQVRRTVLHEIAHHFGISDERLHELGAY
ncbi:MAG: metallopeptidase family protein [Caldilineaceae bacterium]|nr:metallopeptidase family protein [Caldilineaceae bacterium]